VYVRKHKWFDGTPGICRYYGSIQVLSVRAALYQLLAATGDDENRMIYVGKNGDLIHVTNYGHRWLV
jgi:hypothetical protein